MTERIDNVVNHACKPRDHLIICLWGMLGEGVGLGRLKEGRAHPELTVRGYWEIVHLFAKTAGTAVSERLAQQLGKKICPAGGHEGGSWRSKDRTWSGA